MNTCKLFSVVMLLAASHGTLATQALAEETDGEKVVDGFVSFGPSIYLMSMSGSAANALDAKSQTAYGVNINAGFRCLKSQLGSLRVSGELGVYFHSHKLGSSSATFDSTIVPFLVHCGYEFTVAENICLYAGLAAGTTSYDAKIKNSWRWNGECKANPSTFAFNLAGTWQIDENWSVELAYKYAINSDIGLIKGYEKTSNGGHVLAVMAAYRF